MNICLKLCFVGIISAYNLITISDQYETGAPSDVCGDMMPQHNAEPLPLPSPYVISTDKKTIKPADNVAVKIDAKGGNKTYFKGFLCLAKDTLNDTIGFFRPSRGAKLLNYADGQNNVATHSDNVKKLGITLFWRAPPILVKGHVRFTFTIVKDKEYFWVGEESKPLPVE